MDRDGKFKFNHCLAWTLVFVFFSLSAGTEVGASPTSVRIFTFNGDSPWEATTTVYSPTDDGLYRTDKIEMFIKRTSGDNCEDILDLHQRRALDVMFEKRFIPSSLYEALKDPSRRAHRLSQYILATSFVDMTRAEAASRGIAPDRILEDVPDANGQPMVRVHMGSLFAIRGYEMVRGGNEGLALKPLDLAWEVGTLPETLERPLDRANLGAVAEIGRALVEDQAPAGELQRLTHLLVDALSADARILGVDPREFAVFAHGTQSQHLRHYASVFPARLLTPERQRELESDPRAFLDGYLDLPRLRGEEWLKINDGVVFGSLEVLKNKFPTGKYSYFAERLGQVLPESVSREERLALMREFASSMRQDFDFQYHDEYRPGRRGPIQVRDYGTGLFSVRIMRAVYKVYPSASIADIKKIIAIIAEKSLPGDPDFNQKEWIERGIYLPTPRSQTTLGRHFQAISVGNLDATIPRGETESYLANIVVSVAEKIERELSGLSENERELLLTEMSDHRRRRGLAPLSTTDQVNVKTFFDTYDVVVGVSDDRLRSELMIMGLSPMSGFIITDPGKGGHTHLDYTGDAAHDFEIFFEGFNQELREMLAQVMKSIQPTTVYRISMDEVAEQRGELTARAGTPYFDQLSPSFHKQKILRLYLTYQ